jgi:hypothetical protein
VGDALTQAGVRAPTVTMADGSLHYARAETWAGRTDLFNRVTSASDIRVGDVNFSAGESDRASDCRLDGQSTGSVPGPLAGLETPCAVLS